MKTRLLTMGLALLVGLELTGTPALAGLGLGRPLPSPTTDELARDALVQVREAIAEGEAGRVAGFAAHAWQALQITTWAAADPQMTEAAKHLAEAVDAAGAGDTSSGTEHAREAERALEAVG
ncbi:MAG: hypothetical protein HY900_34600 [Deltaproteobacteria bacterium]|nr:hypothetical protein [Deltaproteobacteria bacterium]